MKRVINKLNRMLFSSPKDIVDLEKVKNSERITFTEKYVPLRLKEVKRPFHYEDEKIDTIEAIDLQRIEDNCTKHSTTVIKEGRYLQIYDRNVVLMGDQVISDLSFLGYWEPNPEIVLTLTKYPPLKKLKGKVLCLPTTGAFNNYYTFTAKLLQRIGFAENCGFAIEDFDYFLINKLDYGFQKEFMEIFNIPKSKIVETVENDFYLADELVVPSLSIQNVYGNDYVKNRVLAKAEINFEEVKEKKKRVYLSRKNSKWMNVVNEDEVETILKKYDIETYTFDNMSVLEQARLLQSCELFITPHGAGLTNIIFASEGTNVIEVLNRNRLNMVYYPYALYAGVNYGYVYADADEGQDELEERFKSIILKQDSLEKLENMIKEFLKISE